MVDTLRKHIDPIRLTIFQMGISTTNYGYVGTHLSFM